MLTYTNIQHQFRKANDLTCNEYVLCDMIYFLCTNEKNSSGGWSYAKRETIASDLGLSKQGVLKLIERLVEKGFLVKHPETKFLKTTEKWANAYFEPSVNKVYRHGKQSLPEVGKQSLPNNNNLNNNIDNSNSSPQKKLKFSEIPFTNWNKEHFKQSIEEAREKRKSDASRPNFSVQMLTAFFSYWSEPDARGKMRFQSQKTWATANRLITWEQRDKK